MKCEHKRVVEGTGAMCDGLLCLDCGYEKYPEAWVGPKTIIREFRSEDRRAIPTRY